MTEREVRIINGKEVALYRHKELDSYLFSEDAVDLLLKAFEEVEQYRAIGTVGEFKAYKLGDCMNDCEHYENCSNYIYSKGYNKAIDDFVKEIEAEYDNDGCPNVTDYLDYKISIRDLHKIAEQLKGGAE